MCYKCDMKKILSVIFISVLGVFSAFAEFDLGLDYGCMGIHDSDVEFSTINGVSCDDLKGNLFVAGGLGLSANITYFWNDLENDLTITDLFYGKEFVGAKAASVNTFQTGLYGSFHYFQEYHGNIKIKEKYHLNEDFSGKDLYFALGFDGRFNFSMPFYMDMILGFYFNYGDYSNSHNVEVDTLSFGAECGCSLGYRFLNTRHFGMALCIGGKLAVGLGIGNVHVPYNSEGSGFTEQSEIWIDAFGGLRIMLK